MSAAKQNIKNPSASAHRNAQPPAQTGHQLSCAEILRNNVQETLVREIGYLLKNEWDQSRYEVTNPQAMAAPAKGLWWDIPIKVRFDMSFKPKEGLDHVPASLDDYVPVVKITGSKFAQREEQPAPQ